MARPNFCWSHKLAISMGLAAMTVNKTWRARLVERPGQYSSSQEVNERQVVKKICRTDRCKKAGWQKEGKEGRNDPFLCWEGGAARVSTFQVCSGARMTTEPGRGRKASSDRIVKCLFVSWRKSPLLFFLERSNNHAKDTGKEKNQVRYRVQVLSR
jgi:hypothetical protein